MYFEGRELKTYATPVKVGDLKIGQCYFQLTYTGHDMHIPHLTPLIFIGVDIIPDEPGQFYFQDVDSHASGKRHNDADKEDLILHCCDKNSVNNVFEFENALEGLLTCSLRRKEAGLL